MKLEDLKDLPTINEPTAKEAASPSYINKEWDKEVKAFIEKLNQEGL